MGMLRGTRRALLQRRGGGYSDEVLGMGPIAYWPLWEAAGGVAECLVDSAQNGAYTGVTLGQDGIGDGKTCPLFDGANDVVNIYGAAFAAAFDGAEGSIILWLKVFDVGVWTDGTTRFSCQLMVDNGNRIFLFSRIGNNNLQQFYEAGGSASQTETSGGHTETTWIPIALTWSKAANEVRHYINGVQYGPTGTSPNVWVGNLDPTTTAIGARGASGSNSWHGYLAHCAIWDRPITPSEVAQLAVV